MTKPSPWGVFRKRRKPFWRPAPCRPGSCARARDKLASRRASFLCFLLVAQIHSATSDRRFPDRQFVSPFSRVIPHGKAVILDDFADLAAGALAHAEDVLYLLDFEYRHVVGADHAAFCDDATSCIPKRSRSRLTTSTTTSLALLPASEERSLGLHHLAHTSTPVSPLCSLWSGRRPALATFSNHNLVEKCDLARRTALRCDRAPLLPLSVLPAVSTAPSQPSPYSVSRSSPSAPGTRTLCTSHRMASEPEIISRAASRVDSRALSSKKAPSQQLLSTSRNPFPPIAAKH